MAPRKIGKWTLLDLLGTGGQARVFKAIEDVEGNPVRALKLISTLTPQKRARFEREIWKHLELSTRQTPNIIPILDHNLDEFVAGSKQGFIVMPLAECSIDTEKGLFVGRVELSLEVFRKLLNGVQQAHASEIVHRDIKPANVLFLDRTLREPLLTDFGICFVKEEERLTKVSETVGAKFFMAPEQEQGGITDVDERADLYALGKLLHFMLTGRYLFREQLDRAFEANELARDSRYARIYNEILAKTVVLDPDGRFQNVGELIEAVERILRRPNGGSSSGPITVTPVPGAEEQQIHQQGSLPRVSVTGENGGGVKRSFDDCVALLNSGSIRNIKILFDSLQRDFRCAWEQLLPEIESDPSLAPGAARRLIDSCASAMGTILAICRLDVSELFHEFKLLLEMMLRVSQGRAGYVAIHAVPFVPAGFLYTAASVSSLRWRSWSILHRLLQEKFEWYYQSGRALYNFGFHMAYFFHSDALGGKASEIHDLFRKTLAQPEYGEVLGFQDDDLLDAYVQAQLIHCLRAAQEAEKGDDHGIWPDFGRFHEHRVLALLDRVHADPEYATGLCGSFCETPEVWQKKLNDRLAHIRNRYWSGGNYIWRSIEMYEPR